MKVEFVDTDEDKFFLRCVFKDKKEYQLAITKKALQEDPLQIINSIENTIKRIPFELGYYSEEVAEFIRTHNLHEFIKESLKLDILVEQPITENREFKVEYQTIIDKERYPKIRYNNLNIKYCCEFAKDEDAIKFSRDTGYVVIGLQGYDEADWTEISYCPNCGTKIKCVEIERYEMVHIKKKVLKEVYEDKRELKQIK